MTEESDSISGIADDTKPNAGRVYDFFLGGNHNFEVDREVARQILEVYPALPKMLKMQRWFLGESIRRLLDEGFTQFLDFASGLPVQDHIHQIAPIGTKVIYSDKDPITVAYAQKTIGDNPDVRYLHCKAQHPEVILNSGVVEELFDPNKKVAIGLTGIMQFLPDDGLVHAVDTLYDWAKGGYRLFISGQDVTSAESDGKMKVANDIFANMGSAFYHRSQAQLMSLIKNWKVVEPGCQPFEYWLNLEGLVKEEEIAQIGGRPYGAFLVK